MAKGTPPPQPAVAPKASPALLPVTGKPTKRRSRSSSKPPITILSADAANFRSMVHKLTGFPSPAATAPSGHYPHPHPHPQPVPQNHSSLHLWYSDGRQQQQQPLPGYNHMPALDSPAILYPGQTPSLPFTQATGNTAGFGLNRGGFRIDPFLHPHQGGAAAGGSPFVSMPTLWDASHTTISHK